MDAARARKLGGRIAQIVAEMLERRIKDPRLGFVTVTEARLTNDLREATVFYTVYGSAEERAGTAAALASAVGVIRSEVGRQTGLRHTPSLEFRPDTVPDNARNIEELVARARAADAALAAVREGAEPAGDPDPYRAPAADADPADTDPADDDPGDEDPADHGVAPEATAAGNSAAGNSSAGGSSAGGSSAGNITAEHSAGRRRPATPGEEDDHLAETPAPGERGAGYSRS
jgi:ribosome-binding factor A